MVAHVVRGAILVLAAALRLWHLDQNGYDNEYYAAAVRSMATSWHAFLYNSFDPAGFVSVDKPPVALWIQVVAVKLFGFHGLTLLVPQVLEGVAAVAILDYLVRRRFGVWAGLFAALFLAVMPVSIATDRSNNTESCLVLVLLLAAAALLRAAERGSRSLLSLSMALIGAGFNVKMLAAFVVLPAFALVYGLSAPVSWKRRIVDLAIGTVVLLTVSLSWAVLYDLTPPEHRPFAGSTTRNSMVELAVGHNGLGRFVRLARSPAPATNTGAESGSSGGGTSQISSGQLSPGRQAPAGQWSRLFVRTPAGPLRLADGQLAAQVGWLLPLALLGIGAGLFRTGWRLPLPPPLAALLLWSVWVFTYGVVFSYAGGIFHFYYLVLMAPSLAALAGIGAVTGWALYLDRGGYAALLPGSLIATAAWQLYIESRAVGLALPHDDWRRWLHEALVIGCTIAAIGLSLLLFGREWGSVKRAMVTAGATLGLLAVLVMPTAWALSSVLVKGIPVLPSADLARLAPGESMGGARQLNRGAWYRRLIAFLQENRRGERYLLATSTTRVAAPIIIEAGEPVMAMGGFHGLDPIVTPEKLAHLVETNQVRFVMQGDLSLIDRRMGAITAGKAVTDWIRANGTLVEPGLWWPGASAALSADEDAGGPPTRRAAGSTGGLQLYDLKRSAELVPVRRD
jgi:4-amino-4-deoxy-L-arabinose transferase-like glycosyltransferase